MNEIINIEEFLNMYKYNQDSDIYVCFTNEKKGIIGFNLFKNSLDDNFEYFYLSQKKENNCLEFKINELMNKLKPKLIKSKYAKYKNNLILKVIISNENYEIIEKILNKIVILTNEKIKLSKYEDKYYILINELNNNLSLILFLNTLRNEYREFYYVIYKQYDFGKKNACKVFVEEGYKVYNYDFLMNDKIILIESNNMIVDNFKFEDIYNFLDFNFSKKIEFEELSNNFINVELDIHLVKSKRINSNYIELKNRKRQLEKELRMINRILNKIERNLDYTSMGGFFIEEEKFSDIYYLFLLYNTEDIKKMKIYLFKTKDEFEEYKYYYFFYGPEYLIPNSVLYRFFEDENYSTEKLRILVPHNYQLIPELNLSENEELFEKFIRKISNKNYILDMISEDNYFLILDNRYKFFQTFGYFVKEDLGIDVEEFIKKYAEFGNPKNFEAYIKDIINAKEPVKYEMELDKNLERLFNDIVNNVDFEINSAIEKWEQSRNKIKNMMFEAQKKIDLFIKDIYLVEKNIRNYFEDSSMLDLVNSLVFNIEDFNKLINEKINEEKIETLSKNEYKKVLKDYKEITKKLNQIKEDVENKKNAYNNELKKLSNDLELLISNLINIEKLYRNLEDNLNNKLKEG
ncbi:hypothetical protein [Marinitoga sp. 1155]|uniref:hypothetical protein n=1 Tax=Marinitoga sp. 1155 TaxID=1428448 RepID=UPI0006411E58|nr:hypothetical protein [Marinitoga sp. 1155]KLO23513.1 hypothetical protein X274_06395 [Marinitoga sp. 1155]